MIYIIAGTENEALNFAKKKNWLKSDFLFIPDSEYSMVFKEIPSIIFVGTFRNRKDILDRLMESRDILLAKIADLEGKLIYDDEDNLVTQTSYNQMCIELDMLKEYSGR